MSHFDAHDLKKAYEAGVLDERLRIIRVLRKDLGNTSEVNKLVAEDTQDSTVQYLDIGEL
jgi:hypothetical protein